MKLSDIIVYPVKGGRALARRHADLELEGLVSDRRVMLVDEEDTFLSQREMPRLALLEALPDEDGLHLSFSNGERFVPYPDGTSRATVRIWRDQVDAALADPATNAALSDWLDRPVRLVAMDGVSRRYADRAFTKPQTPVSFADAYPLLVATTASLRALNAAIVGDGGDPVPMSRFRPSLVIDGAEAWAEDGWRTIRVGEAVLDLVEPCARCEVTIVDQQRGEREGKEPLLTLRRIRRSADRRTPGVLFGWNAVPRGPARFSLGDPVEVLEARAAGNLLQPVRAG